MIRIEVLKENGTKTTIETDNAVILYGSTNTKDMLCYSNNDDDLSAEIMDLIVDAKAMYVEKGSDSKDRDKRMALIGIMDIVAGRRFYNMVQQKKEEIESKKTSKNPFNIPPR